MTNTFNFNAQVSQEHMKPKKAEIQICITHHKLESSSTSLNKNLSAKRTQVLHSSTHKMNAQNSDTSNPAEDIQVQYIPATQLNTSHTESQNQALHH